MTEEEREERLKLYHTLGRLYRRAWHLLHHIDRLESELHVRRGDIADDITVLQFWIHKLEKELGIEGEDSLLL